MQEAVVGTSRHGDGATWNTGTWSDECSRAAPFVDRRLVALLDEAVVRERNAYGSVSDVGEVGRSFVGSHLTIGWSDHGAATSLGQGGGR
jgi:hypothetical protein